MHRSLIVLALLQTASALLHSHTKPKHEKYAYITMKYVYGKNIGSDWKADLKNTLNEEEIEEVANKLFDPERAQFEIKKARSFKAKTEIEQEADGKNPCASRDPLRQITRLSKQLSDVDSKYPLIVYTNDECLVNVSAQLPKNIILETNFKYLPKHCGMESKNHMHFQKLGVFGLTKFKKLMWMDWDLEIKKNIDDLFERDTNDGNTIYGQRDDWKCQGKKDSTKLYGRFSSASGGFCSGLMLFEPKKESVDELIASQGKQCWGDQVVIARTFSDKHFVTKEPTGREWKVWDNDVISFRGCQGKFKPRVVHHADLPGNDPGPKWK